MTAIDLTLLLFLSASLLMFACFVTEALGTTMISLDGSSCIRVIALLRGACGAVIRYRLRLVTLR